jgi:hypothetical protein
VWNSTETTEERRLEGRSVSSQQGKNKGSSNRDHGNAVKGGDNVKSELRPGRGLGQRICVSLAPRPLSRLFRAGSNRRALNQCIQTKTLISTSKGSGDRHSPDRERAGTLRSEKKGSQNRLTPERESLEREPGAVEIRRHFGSATCMHKGNLTTDHRMPGPMARVHA